MLHDWDDSHRRCLAQHSVTTLLRHCFEWLQHCSNICNAVLRQKPSLRIVPCNITFKVYRHQQTQDLDWIGSTLNNCTDMVTEVELIWSNPGFISDRFTLLIALYANFMFQISQCYYPYNFKCDWCNWFGVCRQVQYFVVSCWSGSGCLGKQCLDSLREWGAPQSLCFYRNPGYWKHF